LGLRNLAYYLLRENKLKSENAIIRDWKEDRMKMQSHITKENEKAYPDLERTQQTLKGAQSWLIQSEKVTSLGELTIRIAYEIQNPLNLVTIFSKVNSELPIEARAKMDKGNFSELKSIL
jgi:C4-dicarboxylate-specific signal transduction histidine kinase